MLQAEHKVQQASPVQKGSNTRSAMQGGLAQGFEPVQEAELCLRNADGKTLRVDRTKIRVMFEETLQNVWTLHCTHC